MKLCPCGSLLEYESCCGLYIEGHKIPHSAEQLMRSRYTAYALHNWDYIEKTMREKALAYYLEKKSRSKTNLAWVGLKILVVQQQSDLAFIEFIAYFIKKNYIQSIHEKSEFKYQENAWFYTDGTHFPSEDKTRIMQNSPCPCASNKKFKNCHG